VLRTYDIICASVSAGSCLHSGIYAPLRGEREVPDTEPRSLLPSTVEYKRSSKSYVRTWVSRLKQISCESHLRTGTYQVAGRSAGRRRVSKATAGQINHTTYIISAHGLRSCSAPSLFSLSIHGGMLFRSNRIAEAQEFLEAAYQASPNNFDAAFALGTFHLERMLSLGKSHNQIDPSESKSVSTILLKAAKLDSSKAEPFALLGWWYELVGDTKRSLGCYSKALLLNPTNPVAGRGIVRLSAFADIKATCKKAAESTSSENGWAWLALGRASAIEIGRDDTAAFFFQQALRCQDIEKPECDRFHKFYADPKAEPDPSQIQYDLVWIDLANCYRRQGKLNAAVSAYKNASVEYNNHLPSSALCNWAQIELTLGFTEEADDRFKEVLNADPSNPIASFGHATCLLERAKVSATQGKSGLALENLKEASSALQSILISRDRLSDGSIQNSESEYLCVLKLLGDLHSFGYFLPSDVFSDFITASDDQSANGKLEFVSKGEDAYRQVLKSANTQSNPTFLSAAAFDVGVNLLCQAWILSTSMGEGSGGNTPTSYFDFARHENIANILRKAVEIFAFAVDCNPLVSPAWCGLGCALIATEPLKAQHCFCQALHLDMKDTNSYTNIAMLCTNFLSLDAAGEAFDCLTQIADTPLMWIGRGLAHEDLAGNEASLVDQDMHLMNAADAYRAALQVNQNTAALLGLRCACYLLC
jgi:tetratricopeptide (TPR) repeat protein